MHKQLIQNSVSEFGKQLVAWVAKMLYQLHGVLSVTIIGIERIHCVEYVVSKGCIVCIFVQWCVGYTSCIVVCGGLQNTLENGC